MNGGHLMGCQLFMKEKSIRICFLLALNWCNYNSRLHFKHRDIQWVIAILNLWDANCSWKKNRIDFFFISIKLLQLQFEITLKAWWHSMNGCNLEFWNEHTHRHIHRHEHGVLLHIDIHGFLLLINIAFCYMDVDVQF